MVSSAVRGVAASILGVWLFHDIVTTCVLFGSLLLLAHAPPSGRATSIAVILFGSIYYTWIKHKESLPPHNRDATYIRLETADPEAQKSRDP